MGCGWLCVPMTVKVSQDPRLHILLYPTGAEFCRCTLDTFDAALKAGCLNKTHQGARQGYDESSLRESAESAQGKTVPGVGCSLRVLSRLFAPPSTLTHWSLSELSSLFHSIDAPWEMHVASTASVIQQ